VGKAWQWPVRIYLNSVSALRKLPERAAPGAISPSSWGRGAKRLAKLRVMQENLTLVRQVQVDHPGAEGLAGNCHSRPKRETVGAQPEVADR
jgi:hypothetical protein